MTAYQPRQRKKATSDTTEPSGCSAREKNAKVAQGVGEGDGPHDYLYRDRDPAADRLVTRLLQAAHMLAASATRVPTDSLLNSLGALLLGESSVAAPVSLPSGQPRAVQPSEELAQEVRAALGEGEPLHLLFRRLYPAQAGPRPATGERRDASGGRPLLSRREVEVLRIAAEDRSRQEIAERMGISVRTVHRHLENIYRKLGVRRPVQAAARAVAMGYLDMDTLSLVQAAAGCSLLRFRLLDTLLAEVVPLESVPEAPALNQIADMAVLLLVLVGVAGRSITTRRPPAAATSSSGRLLFIRGDRGTVERAFDLEVPRPLSGIVVAPPAAKRHGFTVGNLYAAVNCLAQDALNTGAVAEFTPEGQLLRVFGGGQGIATRLSGCHSVVFAPDGRLLVPSGWMTDAILAFSDGGKTVSRWAALCCSALCLGSDGCLYATQTSSLGCLVKVFDGSGHLVRTLGGTDAGIYYGGIAVDPGRPGPIIVHRWEQGHHYLDVFNGEADGVAATPERSFTVPGFTGGTSCFDVEGNLWIPCRRSKDIKLVSVEEGRVLRRIALKGEVDPLAICPHPGGTGCWVTGHG